MKVAVFGLGYVGTVSAACLAVNGHDVWGVDPDEVKVGAIRAGRSPVMEPGLPGIIGEVVASGRLHATTSPIEAVERADVSFLCVGTPSTAQGGTNLSYVHRVVDDLERALPMAAPSPSGFHGIVVRSTVPPGTVETIGQHLQDVLAATGPAVGVAMCPEFLREGTGIADFFAPPFTVIGTSDTRVATLLERLFDFLDAPVRIVDVRTAEGLKYACNAFHATKIAFANEVARLFGSLGVDSREVMALFCEDRNLNISPRYLRPGFAFGGSCLPKDLRSLLYLARRESIDLPLLSGVLSTNRLSVSEVVEEIVQGPGRRLAILGLSFKAGSDDLRESPYVDLAETLLGKGYEIRIHDPVINPSALVGTNRDHVESRLPHLRRMLTDSAPQALMGAEVAVVSLADPEILEAIVTSPPARIIDLDGRLGPEIEALPGYKGVLW